jgi:hypothetical protein
MRITLNLHLIAALALTGCGKSDSRGEFSSDSDRAKLAAHTLNQTVGPIWPHDSTCFVQVNAQVQAGRLRSDTANGSSSDPAGEAFSKCVDSLENEARLRPATAQRRATLDARQRLDLPAEPRTSRETKTR